MLGVPSPITETRALSTRGGSVRIDESRQLAGGLDRVAAPIVRVHEGRKPTWRLNRVPSTVTVFRVHECWPVAGTLDGVATVVIRIDERRKLAWGLDGVATAIISIREGRQLPGLQDRVTTPPVRLDEGRQLTWPIVYPPI